MTARATVSVVIPVKDGVAWLEELLEALRAQDPDEVLVVDSGSSDGSVEIARRMGAEILEIEPADFGHGRTRNFAAERTYGELICFLTQDATPLPGWLDAYRAAMAAEPALGAAFGPHRARSDTSPMIARELEEFFATFPQGAWPAGEAPFLSNVNACYRRACWAELRFEDVAYSEDQAFARALAGTRRWRVAYVPEAAVLHAHDYGPLTFMRRYFDEYRGLHRTTGHVEGFGLRSTARIVRSKVRADRDWMARSGIDPGVRATTRALVHHGGRQVAAAAGSRADRLPRAVQRVLSLEGGASEAPPVPALTAREGPAPQHVPATGPTMYEPVLEVARDGPTPLLDPVPGMADAERLHIAVVIPYFRRGSGGHSTIYNLLTRLEDRGHTVTTWLYDPMDYGRSEWPAVVRRNLREFFRPTRGPVFKGFDQWYGADVVLATGWDTVFPVLRLPLVRARAYLVQDHEPEFFATSAEALWAAQTYATDLHAICASPWLADIVQERSERPASVFDLGVDHAVYRPLPEVERRDDTVVFYARGVTPRRGVPIGMLALGELHRRRPDTRFVLYGDLHPPAAPFPYEHLSIATPERLAHAYAEATVGLSLSLTNYSLIPQEMLACGLPCVEVAGRSLEGIYGSDGPPVLVPPDPVRLADALERLLDDPGERERRARQGIAFVAELTWDHASEQLEDGLRRALRLRLEEPAVPPAPDALAALRAAETAGPPVPSPFDPFARSVPVDLHTGMDATHRLFSRLSEADVKEVWDGLDREAAEMVLGHPDEERRLLLHYGVYNEVPAVLEKTGLRPDHPPEHVHAMARGPMAAGGSIYYADVLDTAVRAAGRRLADVRRGLDFGCSSGRVVRALAAAYPDTAWHGCDPNGRAIAWAAEHFPEIEFRQSPTETPLPYEDDRFDFVVAISIWSHYAEAAAAHWLNEMARIVRSGGTLVLTTHGLRSVEHYAATGERSRQQLADIARALYRRGFWFDAEFGDEGDWGVRHPDWGTAFLTPEWLLRHARHNWTVATFQVGQNANNQDLYVLVRR